MYSSLNLLDSSNNGFFLHKRGEIEEVLPQSDNFGFFMQEYFWFCDVFLFSEFYMPTKLPQFVEEDRNKTTH